MGTSAEARQQPAADRRVAGDAQDTQPRKPEPPAQGAGRAPVSASTRRARAGGGRRGARRWLAAGLPRGHFCWKSGGRPAPRGGGRSAGDTARGAEGTAAAPAGGGVGPPRELGAAERRGAAGGAAGSAQGSARPPRSAPAAPRRAAPRRPGDERGAAPGAGPKLFQGQVSGSGSREAGRRATGGASAPPRLSDSDHGLVQVALAALLLLEASGPEPRARLAWPRGAARAALRRGRWRSDVLF